MRVAEELVCKWAEKRTTAIGDLAREVAALRALEKTVRLSPLACPDHGGSLPWCDHCRAYDDGVGRVQAALAAIDALGPVESPPYAGGERRV